MFGSLHVFFDESAKDPFYADTRACVQLSRMMAEAS
jgi:hypothetical protein